MHGYGDTVRAIKCELRFLAALLTLTGQLSLVWQVQRIVNRSHPGWIFVRVGSRPIACVASMLLLRIV